jgi:hypothetical protein
MQKTAHNPSSGTAGALPDCIAPVKGYSQGPWYIHIKNSYYIADVFFLCAHPIIHFLHMVIGKLVEFFLPIPSHKHPCHRKMTPEPSN